MTIVFILAVIAFAIMVVRWCKGDYDLTDILIRIGVILQFIILLLIILKSGA